jgi:hypothetical protein|nr:MAG TPA: hypothetical protein [Caudoviricetes sp.]
MNWLYLILIPVFYFLDNLVSYLKLDSIAISYERWLNGTDSDAVEKAPVLRKLILKAGLHDRTVARIGSIAGFSSLYHASVLDSFPSHERDLAAPISRLITQALGVYKDRMINAFNPICWVYTVITLPRSVLSYLDVSAESLLTRICQLVWWLLCAGFALIEALYPEHLRKIIDVLLGF